MRRGPLAVILLTWAVLARAEGGGNASLYGGGDPAAARLVAASARLGRALELIAAGFNVSRLCDPATCGATGDAACRHLAALGSEEKAACRAWLTSRAAELARWNTREKTPLEISATPLRLPGSGRAVAALTKLGEPGPIVLDGAIARASDESALLALLGHELGHKPRGAQGLALADDAEAAPFRSGRALLDAAGAALAVYSLRQAVPAQAPAELPLDVDRLAACRLATTPRNRYLVGLHADATGKLPAARDLATAPVDASSLEALGELSVARTFVRALVGSRAAREATLDGLFHRYLLRAPSAGELSLMVSRVANGVPYEAIVAAILGDTEYASLRGAEAPAAWLNVAFSDLAYRLPSQRERDRFLAVLQGRERASVAIAILKESGGGWNRWIEEWYARWLNRAPSAEELAVHASALRAGAGWETVMTEILRSPEYAALQALRWSGCETPPADRAAKR